MNNYSAREKALYKNWCLVDEQIDMRESFCGVGTRKIKVFLNQKVKKGDKIAELLRVALELNDVNVSAKRYWGDYKRDYYSRKEDLIRDLLTIRQFIVHDMGCESAWIVMVAIVKLSIFMTQMVQITYKILLPTVIITFVITPVAFC